MSGSKESSSTINPNDKNNKNKPNKINKNKPNKINKAILSTKISNLIKHGRTELTSYDELKEYPVGSIISYLNKKNIFKQGGFLTKIDQKYFIYITLDFTTKYRVWFKNIVKIWVGDVHKVNGDYISLVPTSKNKTNFPVKVGDIVVYYASDNFSATRFKNTNKYKIMCKWFETFGEQK